MNKKIIIGLLIMAAIVTTGAYLWQRFDSNNPENIISGSNIQKPDGSRRANAENLDKSGMQNSRTRNTNSVMESGMIIGKNEKSVTLNLNNGGSAIIFYSKSTSISKISEISVNDLAMGQTITADGNKADDGAITAMTVQVRELLPESPESKSEAVITDRAKDDRETATADGNRPQSDSGRSFINGEIISIDGSNIVIKTPGESQVSIILAGDVKITKIEQASDNDLTQGVQVSAMGNKASDGSVVAQMIMIGGEDSAFGMGRAGAPMPEGAQSLENIP